MRISTNTIYAQGGGRISDLQVSLNKTQQQIAAGTRILTPSDDPIAAARALVITQSNAINDQFATNRQFAKNNLSVTEGVLSSATDTLQNVKTLIVNAGNGALSNTDRGYIATELQNNLDQLLSYANATDGTGHYLFSGFNNSIAPYTKTIGGANYVGDQGIQYLQVDSSRQISISDIGSNIFGNIRTSAGQFNALPNPSNTGQAVISVAVDPATASSLTGNNYQVVFDNTAANFSVINKTTGATVVPSTAYTSPQTIIIDGMNITLTNTPGAPGPGDSFSIQPGNQNIFETLTDAINALNTPANTPAAKADLNAALMQANNNIDKSLSNVLTSRATIGANLKEIDNLDNSGSALGIVYKQTLSSLQDLDYAKAITELNQQQVTLQAAQQSFVKTSSLSLFNYIN